MILPPLRLLRSSSFRLAFLAALLFAVTGLGMLGLVRWMTGSVLDQQVDRAVDAELAHLLKLHDQSGLGGLAAEIDARANSLLGRQRVYLLLDGNGRILAGNLNHWPEEENGTGGRFHFRVPAAGGEPESPVRATAIFLKGGNRLLLGRFQGDRLAFEGEIDKVMVWGVVLTLVLGFGVGLILARRAMGRLDIINRTAQTILDGQLQGRVPVVGGGDEFDFLAVNLNGMLDRIEHLVEAMRGVTRNIAHDLRTPLNRLRNRLELALMEGGEAAPPVLAEAIADVDGILDTFNALMAIARIEGRRPNENFQDVVLDDLIAGMAELYAPLAEDKGLEFLAVTDSGLVIQGDRHLLSQALANLLDNAIKYTPPEGYVRISAALEKSTDGGEDKARLTVADSGAGIPADQRRRVLEPFVRLDEARHQPGAGLGLSVVAAVAEVHGGSLLLEDENPGVRAVLLLTSARQGSALKERPPG